MARLLEVRIWVIVWMLAGFLSAGMVKGSGIIVEGGLGLEGLRGIIQNAQTGERVKNAEVRLVETGTGKVLQLLNAADGQFEIVLPDQGGVSIHINAVGFLPLKEELSNQDGNERLFAMQPIEVGKAIALRNVYYDIGALQPRDDAWPELQKLSELLHQNPDLRIEIQSHTDSRGDDDANMAFSQKRAEAIRDLLVQLGIAAGRVTAVGYGETQLLNPCKNGISCAEEFHQQNRRTVFVLHGRNAERMVSNAVPLMELHPDFSSGGYSLAEFLEHSAATPAPAKTENGLRYSILLGIFPQKPDPSFYESLKEYENALFEEKGPGGLTIRVGNVTSQEVADRHLERLKRKGFADARIIQLGGEKQQPELSEPASPKEQDRQQVAARSFGDANPSEGTSSSKADLTVRTRTFRHGFLVQVGAFPGNPGEDFYNQLGDYRYKVVTEVKGNLVRYRIGPYVTREEALNARLDLIQKGFKDAFLVE